MLDLYRNREQVRLIEFHLECRITDAELQRTINGQLDGKKLNEMTTQINEYKRDAMYINI